MDPLPDNWGRWGQDDDIGAVNLLGSEEMFAGLNAATRRGRKGVERFTLQMPMTGDTIDVLVDEAEPPPRKPEIPCSPVERRVVATTPSTPRTLTYNPAG